MSHWGELEQEEAADATRACRQARAEGEGRPATEAHGARRSFEASALATKVGEQQRKIEEQQREIAALKRRLGEEAEGGREIPTDIDPTLRWMMTHAEEMARYRGKQVAVHAERGIIASADDYAQLDELLNKMGVADTEVTIDYVPTWF